MQIQTNLNAHLYQQASMLTGLTDQQLLLEEALRLLIQSKKQQLTTPTAAETLQHFIASENNDALDDVEIEAFSQGRKNDSDRTVVL